MPRFVYWIRTEFVWAAIAVNMAALFLFMTGQASANDLAKTSSIVARTGSGNSDPTSIPLIDAHSQVDCNVSKETVLRQLGELRITRVLVSIRGCKGWRTEDLESRSLQWARDYPDRISALLSTKVDGWSDNNVPTSAISAFKNRARNEGFVGMGEVLIQHAAHNNEQLIYPELSLSLDDQRVAAAVDVARVKGWPVILHIELNDNEVRSRQTLEDLNALLAGNPETSFLLIHMGQASADEARVLLEKHTNIHFLMSHSDDFAAHGLRKARKKGGIAQTGWINLFQGNCNLSDCPSAWKPEWQELILRFPDRFVLAFENVFPNHWGKPYEIKVQIWRRALTMLPPDVAHAVAHRNAERLWKLPPSN